MKQDKEENSEASPAKISTIPPSDTPKKSDVKNSVLVQMHREGPLPDPNEMMGYKRIDPALPDKIVSMAQKEQRFRHISTYLGMAMFPVILLIGFGLAVYAGTHNAGWVGAAIAGAVSYIAYVFKTKDPSPPAGKKEE